MIFLFHSLYFVLKYFLQAYYKSKAIRDFRRQNFFHGSEVNFSNSCRFEEGNILFDPPIYRLRYAVVQQILLHEIFRTHITKVVDFGCGNLNLFQYLKRLYGVRDILCVDVDENLLKEYVSKVYPLIVDYLKKRSEPLQVQVLCGSVSDPDCRLKGANAVICIEIIEHLYPDVLEALPYNLFHFIQPLIAVFTTPNADFNELFPNPGKFRHADHKFEWTRQQFQEWADNIITRFPKYMVTFEGIGKGPSGTDHLGCSTQIAIFVWRDLYNEQFSEVPRSCREVIKAENVSEPLAISHGICTYFSYSNQISRYEECLQSEGNSTEMYYKLIEKVEYPYEVDNRSVEEKILQEVLYKVYRYMSVNSIFYNEETEKIQLPLRELTSNEEGYYTTIPEIKKLLEKENFKIEECVLPGSSELALCVIYDPDMDNRSHTPENESDNSEEKNDNHPETSYTLKDEKDWDLDQTESYIWKSNLEHHQNELEITEKPSKSSLEETKHRKSNLTNNLKQPELIYCNLHVDAIDAVNSEQENKQAPPQLPKDSDSTKKGSSTKTAQNKTQSISESTVNKRVPKKGTNTKNSIRTATQGSSKEARKSLVNATQREISNKRALKKSSCDVKDKESTYSLTQGPSSVKNLPKRTASNNPSTKPPIVNVVPKKKLIQEPIAGTSDIKKKRKLNKLETDLVRDDVKDITECILYNSLNKIQEVDDEGVAQDVDVDVMEQPQLEAVILVQPAVENGDLANNNRDLEGNNYPDEAQFMEMPDEDKENDNVQMELEEGVRNQDFQNRNNDDAEMYVPPEREDLVEHALGQELNYASREALFDPNSEVDMLDEFEIPPPSTAGTANISLLESHNVILISMNQIDEDNVVLPENADPFPIWLLQLLGANVDEGESHDEPHFYCQGDGIGVHPSIVEVEIDEEHTSESSSSDDEAEAEHTISEPEVGPLPRDENDSETLLIPSESLEVTGAVLVPTMVQAQNISSLETNSTADSGDEYFDTVDETLLLDETSPRTNAQD